MKKFILVLVLLLASALRLYQLNSLPTGLTWDEAALGYNTYSILKTGRDEHGQFLPLIFKSFGDYKPGAYVYLDLPFVALGGLNEWTTRLPSAISGILAVWGVYLLVNQLFEKNKNLGLFAALALAISPWHIHFSRGAWEVNLFTTQIIFLIFFLNQFRLGKGNLWPAAFLFSLALITYQGAKLLTPLILLSYFLIYNSDLIKQVRSISFRKISPFFLLASIVLTLIFSYLSFGGEAANRLKRLSIFGYNPPIAESVAKIDHYDKNSLQFFHNRLQLLYRMIAGRYFYHFSPEVLFYEGKIQSFLGHIPGMGMLNHLEFIWLGFGLIFLAKNWPSKASIFVITLLLLAPIPSALTLSEFSTIRSLPLVIPLSIISGLGMYYCLKLLSVFSLPVFSVYFVTTILFVDLYFVHSQPTFYQEFNRAYVDAVVLANKIGYQKLVMTDVYGQPYIYYVYYSRFDPTTFQRERKFVEGGVDVGSVLSIGENVRFQQFGESDFRPSKNTVFIGTEGNIKNDLNLNNLPVERFEEIKSPEQKIILKLLKTRP